MNDVQIISKNKKIIIENSRIKREFTTENYFQPFSFIDKFKSRELIRPHIPWFLFNADGKMIDQSYYLSHGERKMKHGGIEVEVFTEAEGILIIYQVQIYPGCALTRERLKIVPGRDGLKMNQIGSDMLMSFPSYAINTNGNSTFKEIRLSTWNAEQMPEAGLNSFPLKRKWGETDERGLNLSQCDMYHPVFKEYHQKDQLTGRGPVFIGTDSGCNNWILAYEHGSPDNDSLKEFLQLRAEKKKEYIKADIAYVKGAFLDNEFFSQSKPLVTPWVVFGTYQGNSFNEAEKEIWDYLYYWQSETRSGRQPLVYYNTWGWQRDEEEDYVNVDNIKDKRMGSKVYRDAALYEPILYNNIQADGGKRKHFAPDETLLIEERFFEEIDYAHDLSVDVFVIDDGWYDWMGDWNMHPQFGEERLREIVKRLKSYGMRLGIWLAPSCVDPHSKFYQHHFENMAVKENGTVQDSRFGRKMACIVSPGYADYFIEKCKKLIDLGCTYFKWDALDGWPCYSGLHGHGEDRHHSQDRAARYGYEFSRTISYMADHLIEYCPSLVIAYDITETGRYVGLDFLSRGRYFWMNNGASGYYDYSTYRAKSMRTIYHRYSRIIPSVLQPVAQYPHALRLQPGNRKAAGSQDYKLYSALVGGNGFWGNLAKMDEDERRAVQDVLRDYKRVSNTVVSTRPLISGKIGGSPEIYEFLNSEKAQGQVIAFSGSILQYDYFTCPVSKERFLGVLRHAYELTDDDRIKFRFYFTEPDSARACFIIGHHHSRFRIEKSSCFLKDINLVNSGKLRIENGAPGELRVVAFDTQIINKVFFNQENVKFKMFQDENNMILEFVIERANEIVEIEIESERNNVDENI